MESGELQYSANEFDTLDDIINKNTPEFILNRLEEIRKFWKAFNFNAIYAPDTFKIITEHYESIVDHPLIFKTKKTKNEDDMGVKSFDSESFDYDFSLENEDSTKKTFFFGEGNILSNRLILFQRPNYDDISKQEVCSKPRKILDEIIDSLGGIDKCYIGYVFPFMLPKEIIGESGKKKDVSVNKIRHIQYFYDLTYMLVTIMKPKVIIAVGKEVQKLVLSSFSIDVLKYMYGYSFEGFKDFKINSKNFTQFADIKTTVFAIANPYSFFDFASSSIDHKNKEKVFDPVIKSIKIFCSDEKKESVNDILKLGSSNFLKDEERKRTKKIQDKKKQKPKKLKVTVNGPIDNFFKQKKD